MNSEWDEVKRLAADLQKVQLSSTLQKLSERNCVEIVTLLLEKKLIDVIFTNDGREYVSPAHLEREILDELSANGGRVNLVELAKTLNVDLSKIDIVAQTIVRDNDDIHCMLGQLISEDYILNIAQEINEKLGRNGEINISDLTVQFDLPSEFLQLVVEKHIGKVIKGRQDPFNSRIFFTQSYIQRCKCKIRGALAAVTRPTPVTSILQQINVQEKNFYTVFDEISPAGTLTSKLSNAQYVPHIYAKMQLDWVDSFYKQNGFLEYDGISKLGISDPVQYIKKNFPEEEMIFLKRCAVGTKIVNLSLLTALNECRVTKSYIDLTTILPSNMTDEDVEELLSALQTSRDIPNDFVYLETIVFSDLYLTDLIQPCVELANIKAKNAVETGIYQQFLAEKQLSANKNQEYDFDAELKSDKRDERRKKASSGKGGGGTQGRETKTKSTKRHQRGTRVGADSGDENDGQITRKGIKVLEIIKPEEIEKIIKKNLDKEGLEHLSGRITELYQMQLNQIALQTAQNLFESTPQTNRRKTHSELQEKLNSLLVDIRLYEKGIKLFPSDVQLQLAKYLNKSLGNEICNELTLYVANECNLNLKRTDNLNVDQRNKIVQECDSEYRNTLIELNKSLNGPIDTFLLATENALKACSMIVKKIDKKKDRSLVLQHREKLIQQLKESDDPALVLHLAALILFTTHTGNLLLASGRFVSHILNFMHSTLSAEQNKMLMEFHDLVLKHLKPDDADGEKVIGEQLTKLQQDVKDFAVSYQKSGVAKAE